MKVNDLCSLCIHEDRSVCWFVPYLIVSNETINSVGGMSFPRFISHYECSDFSMKPELYNPIRIVTSYP